MPTRARRISVTEAARNFADVINRAFYRQETTILVKNGVDVAHIAPAAPDGIPAAEALARWRTIQHLDAAAATEFKRDLAAARNKLPKVRSPWR